MARMTADRAEALDRLTTRMKCFEPGDGELAAYFIVCMAILGNNAPEVLHFILDRANEQLGFASDSDKGDDR